MIAFACVHCGQRMTLTESGDGKQAYCPSCHKLVLVPGRLGLRRLGNGGFCRTSSQLATLFPPAPQSGTAATPNAVAVHQLPTRLDSVAPQLANQYTVFLAPPLEPGELGRLAGYRIWEVVGAGGMGVVFRAEELSLQREVALKAMLPSLAAHPAARQRFRREARAAAALQHDHIVTIYQVGEARGIPFLVMPFLRGQSLETRLQRDSRLPEPEVRRIGRELAEGLLAIHEHGLVHRDIKPGNIWLEGEAGRVKILDFGLARSLTDGHLTQQGSLVGSPAFMSPEQARRQPVDSRADLFSLGCVLYLLVSGRLPFEGEDALSTLFAITSSEPPPLVECSPELARLIHQLLAKDPQARPASARRVLSEL
ncbi:MAG: protein kinase [Gemmataceae bacterium]